MKKLMLFFAGLALVSCLSAQVRDTARVNKVSGVPVYVMCDPTASYEVVGKVSDETAGSLLSSSTTRTMKESIQNMVQNADRKKKKGKFDYDAILVSDDCKTGTCIKWK